MTVEIVILALIAAFLGLRLYSVLGKRTGHEQELPRRVEQPEPRAIPAPQPVAAGERATERRAFGGVAMESGAEAGLKAIMAADRGFDVTRFVEGAKAAYGMILEAYWRGDRDELAQLCDRDVYKGFVDAIDAREAAGETLDNRLVRIERARIVNASCDGGTARIAVQFDADIAAVTRNAEGEIIAGSTNDAVETHDIWTFARDVTSRDPNWLLDETDVA